jgi:hypothetical protein
MNRKEGYYWVRNNDQWDIWKWDGSEWWCFGSDSPSEYESDDFDLIWDERISMWSDKPDIVVTKEVSRETYDFILATCPEYHDGISAYHQVGRLWYYLKIKQ